MMMITPYHLMQRRIKEKKKKKKEKEYVKVDTCNTTHVQCVSNICITTKMIEQSQNKNDTVYLFVRTNKIQ
jgi:hypothetical protein